MGIATCYGLQGLGVDFRWRRNFPQPYRPSLCPRRFLYNRYFFPAGKQAGAWRWPPTPSSVEVKETVELNFYSPSWPSCPFLGRTLRFLIRMLRKKREMWSEFSVSGPRIEADNFRTKAELLYVWLQLFISSTVIFFQNYGLRSSRYFTDIYALYVFLFIIKCVIMLRLSVFGNCQICINHMYVLIFYWIVV